MEKGMFFWLVMFLIFIAGCWGFYPPERRGFAPYGVLMFLAVALLGWQVFGNAVR